MVPPIAQEVMMSSIFAEIRPAVFSRSVSKTNIEEPAIPFKDDEVPAFALFGGIGLLVAFIAVACGQQGIWL